MPCHVLKIGKQLTLFLRLSQKKQKLGDISSYMVNKSMHLDDESEATKDSSVAHNNCSLYNELYACGYKAFNKDFPAI